MSPGKPLSAPDLRADDDAETADAGEAAEAAEAEAEVECRRERVPAPLHGERLDKLLVQLAPEFSRSHLQSLVAGGHVRVQGRVATTASRRVKAGDAVELDLIPTAQSTAFRAEPIALRIVHEDDHVLVVDKPAGLVVHPAPGHWSGTLLNALLAHHEAAATLPRAGIVHRLDKDTSGLMVVAKSLEAMTALVRAIAARDVQREYAAIAHGRVDPRHARIDAPIGRDPVSRVRMAVVPTGRPARTDVTPVMSRDGFSALHCALHTGRTHQIRVHLASVGHPLVADALYGGAPALGLTRQALHARRLTLQHPVAGGVLSLESAPPEDFARAWSALTRNG